MQHKIKIKLSEIGLGSVLLDGHEISNCIKGLTINSQAGELNTVEVRLILTEVEFEGLISDGMIKLELGNGIIKQ